jgi:hypothetical protein
MTVVAVEGDPVDRSGGLAERPSYRQPEYENEKAMKANSASSSAPGIGLPGQGEGGDSPDMFYTAFATGIASLVFRRTPVLPIGL